MRDEKRDPASSQPESHRLLPREYPNLVTFDEVLERTARTASPTPKPAETTSAGEAEAPAPAESGTKPQRDSDD